MTPVTTCAGRTLALFGLGGSGLVTAKALTAGGARVLAWDDADASRESADAQGIEVVDLRTIDWSSVSSLVLSPGVPLTHPEPHWAARLAQAAGVEVIGDIEVFCRERARIAPDAPFIAITGTNGKSTTTALTAHLFRTAGRDVQMGGNIGIAALALEPPAPGRIHVLEVSSYQIDLAPSLAPTLGMLLNLTPDHLDRHGSMAGYAAVKERLIAKSDWSLVGVDDAFSSDIFDRACARRAANRPMPTPVSIKRALPSGVFLEGRSIVLSCFEGKTRVLGDLGAIPTLRGSHNAQNACFAARAADIYDLCAGDSAAIQRGLESFPGLPHRLEEVGRRGSTLFINDSKATNADSTEKALLSFPRVFWILGGKAKEGGIADLRPHLPRVEHAYLIGEASDEFAAVLDGEVPYTRCDTLDAAVPRAAADAARAPGGESVVLFSPACASFDQFKNFEVRGERFRALVQALPT